MQFSLTSLTNLFYTTPPSITVSTSQENTQLENPIQQIAAVSLTPPDSPRQLNLNEDKTFIPLSGNEELLVDQEKLQKLAESLVDDIDHEWTMIDDSEQELILKLTQSIIDDEWTMIEDTGEEKPNSTWLNQWAVTGGVPLAGAVVGTVQQMIGSKAGLSVLQGVNLLKQIEIKNCAYALPMAPLFIDLASKVYQDESDDVFSKKVMKAAAAMDKKEVAFMLASCGLSLATAGMHGTLLRAGMITFDLSGHIMTKTVSSALIAKGLKEGEEGKISKLKKAAAYTYIASDALMLHKTAMRFHTPEETIAGALWGLVNLGVAHVLANKFTESPVSTPLETKTEEDQEPTVTRLTEQPFTIIEDYFPESIEKEESPILLKEKAPLATFIIKDYLSSDEPQ